MSHDLAPFPTYPVSTPGDPAVQGPAGWHPIDDIKTVTGLRGSFLWNENPVFPTVIAFDFVPREGGQEGTYTIRFGPVVIDQGPFFAAPNNPAGGYAIIVLQPSSPMPRAFVITGMLTDSNWRIYFMRLSRFVGNNPGPVSFSALRIS